MMSNEKPQRLIPAYVAKPHRFDSLTDPGLPAPDLVSYYELEKNRLLYIDSEIDDRKLSVQRMILRWNKEDEGKPVEERQPVRLCIFSPGGDVDTMWSLIDTIEASVTPVFTIDVGVAASAAGLIFLAGKKRFMLRRSRLLIHEGSACMYGDAVKVLDASENYKKQMKLMSEYILTRTRISTAVLARQKCHDWELDATYCLEHGACEMIVDKLDDIL